MTAPVCRLSVASYGTCCAWSSAWMETAMTRGYGSQGARGHSCYYVGNWSALSGLADALAGCEIPPGRSAATENSRNDPEQGAHARGDRQRQGAPESHAQRTLEHAGAARPRGQRA